MKTALAIKRSTFAVICSAALLGACERRLTPSELARIESVMTPGMVITARTANGPITITAKTPLKRSYTFKSQTLRATMTPRTERWYGSLGLYDPGFSLGLIPRSGIYRVAVEEGQQHFDTAAEALQWLGERKWMPYVYTSEGLVVGWSTTPQRHQLNAEVWQLLIQHKKPTDLPGAADSKITVKKGAGAA